MMNSHSEFVRMYVRAQQTLLSYIMSCGYNFHDAEDLLQDAAVVLLERFETYDGHGSFIAWSLGYVRNLVLNESRKRKVRTIIQMDTELVGKLASTLQDHEERIVSRRDHLETCFNQLPVKWRALLKDYYDRGLRLHDLATSYGKTYAAMNSLLCRIRSRLLDCSTQMSLRTNP